MVKRPYWVLAGLNTFDAIMTFVFITNGWAVELNPLMRYLFGISGLFFLFVKIVLGNGLVYWIYKQNVGGNWGIKIANIFYAAIAALHLYNVAMLILRSL